MKNYTLNFSLAGLFVCLIIFSGCTNKEKYLLEYKLSPGDIFKQKMEMSGNIVQNYMEQEIALSTNASIDYHYTVKEVEGNTFSIDMTYDRIKMNIDMGGTKISFDSNTEDTIATPQNLSPMIKAITGIPLNIVIDNKGKASSFTGMDKIFESMTEAVNPDIDAMAKQQMLAALNQQFSDEFFQTTINNAFYSFPDKEITIGYSWDMNTEINSQGIGMSSTLNIKLEKVEGNIATLVCNGTLSTPREGITQETNGMTVTITMEGTMKGTVLLDMNSGMITKGEMTQDLKAITTMGEMEIPQTINTKTTLQAE